MSDQLKRLGTAKLQLESKCSKLERSKQSEEPKKIQTLSSEPSKLNIRGKNSSQRLVEFSPNSKKNTSQSSIDNEFKHYHPNIEPSLSESK